MVWVFIFKMMNAKQPSERVMLLNVILRKRNFSSSWPGKLFWIHGVVKKISLSLFSRCLWALVPMTGIFWFSCWFWDLELLILFFPPFLVFIKPLIIIKITLFDSWTRLDWALLCCVVPGYIPNALHGERVLEKGHMGRWRLRMWFNEAAWNMAFGSNDFQIHFSPEDLIQGMYQCLQRLNLNVCLAYLDADAC